MSSGVLLVVNCALDPSYQNRFVLNEMYKDRFDEIVFTVSSTCTIDGDFRTVAQSWEPAKTPRCICSNPDLGEHGAILHSFHPRLIEVAHTAAEYDYVLFTEDDCILTPRSDSDWIRSRCRSFDAVAPRIRFCDRANTGWVWTQHGTGYPAFDTVADSFDRDQLMQNWTAYGGEPLPDSKRPPVFCGFCDWFILKTTFLEQLVNDLRILQTVWHEMAIPTALLHNTSRIAVSNGLALWGTKQHASLEGLMGKLRERDFVHPIKLRRYSHDDMLDAYAAVGRGVR